jgi:hypothetical protein
MTAADIPAEIAAITKEIAAEEATRFNPEEIDNDISKLFRGERITRSFKFGSKIDVVIRHLLPDEIYLVRLYSSVIDPDTKRLKLNADGSPVINSETYSYTYSAMAIQSISGVELVEIPNYKVRTMDEDESKEVGEAIDSRIEYLRSIPGQIIQRILVECDILTKYVAKISSQEVLENF